MKEPSIGITFALIHRQPPFHLHKSGTCGPHRYSINPWYIVIFKIQSCLDLIMPNNFSYGENNVKAHRLVEPYWLRPIRLTCTGFWLGRYINVFFLVLMWIRGPLLVKMPLYEKWMDSEQYIIIQSSLILDFGNIHFNNKMIQWRYNFVHNILLLSW